MRDTHGLEMEGTPMRVEHTDPAAPLTAPQKVLCHVEVAIDDLPQTAALVPVLSRYIRPERVVTRFVYAVPVFMDKTFAEESAAQQEALHTMNRLLDAYSGQMASQSLTVADRTFIQEGRSVEASLVSHLEETPVDLLVMGTENPKTPHKGWRIDSTSYYVATHAPTSVLVVKQPIAQSAPLKVLFATDGSEYAQRALAKLMTFLPTQNTVINVLSVVSVNSYVLPVVEPYVDYTPLERAMTGEATSLLAETKKTLESAGYTVAETTFAIGDPVDQILEATQSGDINLILMGSHGRGNRLSQMLLGSVSARVLEYATCSVGILK